MAAMFRDGRWGARRCEAFSGNVEAGEFQRLGPAMLGTFPGSGPRGFGDAKARNKMRVEQRQIAFTSRGASVCGRRDRAITKKIIGRGMSIFCESFNGRSVFRHVLGAFPLLHEPTGQHGGGIFLNPKIEKRADLLAEIGGMAKPREFIGLQRISRSGEQELPRRLSFVVVHAGLLGRRFAYVNT
jgi:hypothetical protein